MSGQHASAAAAPPPWGTVTVPDCPVCGAAAGWFDVVDFNKHGSEARGVRLPLSGQAVYYARCGACGFCFAPELHRWSALDMSQRIYNDGYVAVDPDYVEVRPRANAQQLQSLFPHLGGGQVRHLDYGSGSGRMAQLLREAGWASRAYDPFVPGASAPAADEKFALITAFEVFEHVADLPALTAFLRDHLADDGLLVFSTLLSDGAIQPGRRLDWWYACPRNGHISLFSQQSLKIVLQQCGMSGFAQLGGPALFIACRQQWPAWAQHLIRHGQP
ncbi:MAG: class I SAM-dependent methyltransferase [Pseudomonadota bacterium]